MIKSKKLFRFISKSTFISSLLVSSLLYGQNTIAIKPHDEALQNMKQFQNEISEVSGYSSDIMTEISVTATKELLVKMISSLNEAIVITQSAEKLITKYEGNKEVSVSQSAKDDLAEALADVRELNTETNRVLRKVREATSSESSEEIKTRMFAISKILKEMNGTILTAEASLQKASATGSATK